MAERSQRADVETTSHQSLQPTAFLTIVVPNGRRKDMRRILKPFFTSVYSLDAYLHLREADSLVHSMWKASSPDVPKYSISGDEMSSPSLSVISFLPEFGPKSADSVRQKFRKLPWRHHHTIQLQKAGSSNVLGKHEFYSLSCQLPLWSVGISPHNVSFVRFNLFVRRFNAMVEFYRLITGTEMESRKPGFSLFSIGKSQSCENLSVQQTACELVLKHCPQVSPYPLKDAFLTFPVHNLQSLLAILQCKPQFISTETYLVHDPDGNSLLLYESSRVNPHQSVDAMSSPVQKVCQGQAQTADKVSVHSDSIDSGRYSDFDACSYELDQCMSRLVSACKLDVRDDLFFTFNEHRSTSTGRSSARQTTASDSQKPKIFKTRPPPEIDPPLPHTSLFFNNTPVSNSPHRPSSSTYHTSNTGNSDSDHGNLKVKNIQETQANLADQSVASCSLDDADLAQFLHPTETNVPRSKFIADLRDYGYLNPVQTPGKDQNIHSFRLVYDATFL